MTARRHQSDDLASHLLIQNITTLEASVAKLLAGPGKTVLGTNSRGQPSPEYRDLVHEWVDASLFADPDRSALGSSPALICRWLCLAGELMVGEDHVDWACGALAEQFDAAAFTAIDTQLCLKTLCAFEDWFVREEPPCLGMVPLLKRLAAVGVVESVSQQQFLAHVVSRAFSVVAGVFRKRSKGESHLPIPPAIDEAMSELVAVSFQDALTEDWISFAFSLLKGGVKRFPVTLRVVAEKLFLRLPSSSSSSSHDLLLHNAFVLKPYFTRQLLESLSKQEASCCCCCVPNSVVHLFPAVAPNLASWPLHDVVTVVSFSLSWLAQNRFCEFVPLAESLLAMALRSAYFSMHVAVTMREHSLTVETALCANKFLQLLRSETAEGEKQLMLTVQAGLPTKDLAVPAEAVLSRFPQLHRE